MISEQDKSRVLMASDIVEVIESYVPLKKAGQNYKGLCPFHNEKTPSFTVSPNKQIFHCFGCGESGGAISFLMKHEHLSYPEAVKALAERYNIEIEEKDFSPEQREERNKAESFAGILKFSTDWFRDQLLNSELGRSIGLSYLSERGIAESMIEKFSLGYCPENGRSFSEYALSKGYSKEFLEELGLIKENDRGIYDIYRGRLIFPITELGGKIIAFGARALKKGQQPKYINSPEHLIYHKSRTLYALNDARKSIGQEDNVYVVEGYTDVIAMHQAGVENTVATCGTAVTEDHISRLRHMTKNVTLLFDADQAGQKAILRTIAIVLKSGLNVGVVALPEGEDPDSLTKQLNAHDFQLFLKENRKDFLQYLVDSRLAVADDPIKKAEASKLIIEAIAAIPDSVKRAFYVQDSAALLGIDEKSIAKEISKINTKKSFKDRGEYEAAEQLVLPKTGQKSEIEKVDVSDSGGQEEDIIRLLLLHGNKEYSYQAENELGEEVKCSCLLAEYVFEEISFNQMAFQNPVYEQAYQYIQAHFSDQGKVDLGMLIQSEDQRIVKCISTILSKDVLLSDNWTAKYNIHITREEDRPDFLVESALNKLKVKTVFQNRARLMDELTQTNDENDQNRILKKIQQLDKIKAELSDYFGISVY